MSEHKLEIQVGPSGHGSVMLNGQDISRFVAGLTLRVQPGAPPMAEVIIHAPARVVCEAAGVEWVEPPLVESLTTREGHRALSVVVNEKATRCTR